MKIKVGILHETKNEWERRVPLIPQHVAELTSDLAIDFVVQPSKKRIFADEEYKVVGARIDEDLSDCSVILGIKEIKIQNLLAKKTYLYFSHTIKGQAYNMPMLKELLNLKCTLIDYEKIASADGKRLIFFSLQAGLAGIIDTLWAFGQRLAWEGIESPFTILKQMYNYSNLKDAETALHDITKEIKKNGLNRIITPLVIGITGYGNVSKGVQQLLEILPLEEIKPNELTMLNDISKSKTNAIFKVIFKEEDMVEPIMSQESFQLQDYYKHPQKYRSNFSRFLPYLSILVNASFWDTPYPRHVKKSDLYALYVDKGKRSLRVIGDISCDVEGGVECTLKVTDPGNPVYVYDPHLDSAIDGIAGPGPVIMAVDNLPSELPREASIYFSGILKPFIPALVKADYTVSNEELKIPSEIKNALIVYQGKLTADYEYLEKYLAVE